VRQRVAGAGLVAARADAADWIRSVPLPAIRNIQYKLNASIRNKAKRTMDNLREEGRSESRLYRCELKPLAEGGGFYRERPRWGITRIAIFTEKYYLGNTDQTENFIHSIGITPVSRKGKHSEFRYSSEFHSNPIDRREKHSELGNFVPYHSAKGENARNFFPIISQKRNIILNHWRKKKKIGWLLKNSFSRNSFRFVAFRLKLAILKHTKFRKRSTFFLGITKTVPWNSFGTEFR